MFNYFNSNEKTNYFIGTKMGFFTFLSNLSNDIIDLSGEENKDRKGIYGKWQIDKMGPAKSLKAPEQSTITYQFNYDNTLIVHSPYKQAQRKFHTNKQHIKFDGFGLFGGYKKFIYSVSKNNLTLKTEKGFVVTLKRV